MSVNRTFPLNVAVIGAGFGCAHLPGILKNSAEFRLRMICEPNKERVDGALNAIRKEAPDFKVSDCRIVGDYHEAIGSKGIDVVLVSLPHHMHAQACAEAADAGKHIVVDKPIARTLEEADQIIEAVDRNKVTLMVAFNYRFSEVYQKMNALVNAGEIGQPIYAVTRHYQGFNPPANANWRSKNSVGGGCVMGSGIHNIDMMRWMLGEPDEVFAYGNFDPQRLEAEAVASISFKYRSGLVVNFSCSWSSSGALDGWWNTHFGEFEIFGSKGDLAFFNGSLRVGHMGKPPAAFDSLEINPYGPAMVRLWAHFANAIQTGGEPITNARDSKKTLALVLNVYRSMETGKPVKC